MQMATRVSNDPSSSLPHYQQSCLLQSPLILILSLSPIIPSHLLFILRTVLYTVTILHQHIRYIMNRLYTYSIVHPQPRPLSPTVHDNVSITLPYYHITDSYSQASFSRKDSRKSARHCKGRVVNTYIPSSTAYNMFTCLA